MPLSRAALGLLVSALLASASSLSAQEPARTPARYLVFEIGKDGAISPLAHRVVDLAGPLLSKDEAQLALESAQRTPEMDRVFVRLESKDGETLFRNAVDVARWIRGEFPADDQADIERHLMTPANRAFVVRVPFASGSRLFLRVSGAAADTAFDTDALAADRSLPLADYDPGSVLLAQPSANPANRVDLLVMGDGYTSAQQAQFVTDTGTVLNNFFSVTPYSQYQNFVNTYTLFTASNQSGADQPHFSASCVPATPPTCCSDPATTGVLVDTAFDATFCSNNLLRLLTVNTGKVLTAAAAQPDWDLILVVVNDPTYGGSGGQIGVISMNGAAVQIAQHEYGHSFTLLADEYSSPYPGYPPCSDVTTSLPPCEFNVTDETRRGFVKWTSWIAQSTPVPTPDRSPYLDVLGLFQGARYLTSMYRPKDNCTMQTLGVPFCAVCRQSYVLRLYSPSPSWGNPAGGIDNIEPGTENPPPGTVEADFPGTVTLSASLLQPAGGPGLSVNWLVNGLKIAGATDNSFTLNPGGPGTYTVALQTKDANSFVSTAMAGTALDHSRTWTVTFGSGGSGVSVSALSPTSGPGAAGDSVSVVGGGFLSGATVSFGGVPGTNVTVVSSGSLTAGTPGLTAGTLNDVVVTNALLTTSTMVRGWFADFLDVPTGNLFHAVVEQLVRNRVTAGCGGGNYCPDTAVTRAQMAVFLLKSKYGKGYVPPLATGTIFGDVRQGDFGADWIEQLADYGITTGCGGGNYCPGSSITRAQMAVFLLAAKHPRGYQPPVCTGIWQDVPCPSQYANWIEELTIEGLTSGCGGSMFCPGNPVTRSQMASFLVRTFSLP